MSNLPESPDAETVCDSLKHSGPCIYIPGRH